MDLPKASRDRDQPAIAAADAGINCAGKLKLERKAEDMALHRAQCRSIACAEGRSLADATQVLARPEGRPSHVQSLNTYAKISGATMLASELIKNLGVSTASFPHVIFSLGGAPE